MRRPAVLWRWFKRRFPPSLKLASVSAVVGAAAGGGAILFWAAVSMLQGLLFGAEPRKLASGVSGLPWWQVLAIPTVGGLIVGWVVHRVLQQQRPHGVADVIEATALHGGRLSLKNGLAAALVSSASIGCGASVGREGPIVHFGATLGAWIAKKSRISQAHMRRLIACGVAAGVAASFNAPIAGAVFAIEVVVGKYTLHTFAPIAISTVVGTSISRLYYGNDPAFSIPGHAVSSLQELPAYALLGIASALVTVIFLHTVSMTQAVFDRAGCPGRLRPAFGGLLVGLIGLYAPQVLGVGYETTNAALQEVVPLSMLAMLVVAKILATGVSLGSGFGGGVFSPSLFIGAMTGGVFGSLWQSSAAGSVSGYGSFTIVGMGAVVAATLGAPLSTTLIVFEMTGDYSLTLAVMFAAITSSLLVNDVWGRSFFSWQLLSRGVDLGRSRTERLMDQVRVADLMNTDVSTVEADANRDQVLGALKRAEPVYVVGENGGFRGILTFADLAHSPPDAERAGELCRPGHVLHDDDRLSLAMTLVKNSNQRSIPVVSEDESGRLVGHVAPITLLDAYRGVLDRAASDETS